jgi:anion-transporting  ArsA/GET3 family ATPase
VTAVTIVTGAGGVGKTTLAAAVATSSARAGRRTLVLTVDPARRLADTLGITDVGNEPTATPQPLLSAAMLDASAAWDEIAVTHAPPDVAARLLANPFFRAVADRFPSGQAYAASEQMVRHAESGAFDHVVVDTPPADGGLEFLTAPRRMRRLVGGRVLSWLTGSRLPGRRTLYKLTARPALKVADTVLGGPLLEDVADFLLDLRETYDGVTARSRVVERHLRLARTVVVTTADPAPVVEAVRFFRELPQWATAPDIVVFNRTLPEAWAEATPQVDPLGVNLARWGAEARRQAEVRREVEQRYGVRVATVPWRSEPPATLEDLSELVEETAGLLN